MINLHCTQKLIAKLPVKDGLLPEGEQLQASLLAGGEALIVNNPLSGWHANLLTLQRRNCVLLVHNTTRFPLFMIGLTKKDIVTLDYHFADCLMNTLLKVGANEDHMQAAQALLAPVSICKSNDRSVQGTLNQMSGDIEHMLWYDNAQIIDCSPYKTAAWLANRPCSVKSREVGAAKSKKVTIWPVEAMLKLLDSYQMTEREY
ncbi:MAG: DUF6933 domain-containing protein [Pseudoalteromonas sp.]